MRIVPPWAWLVAGLLYVVCPLDFDFVPVIGWIDDIVVASIAIRKWRSGVQAQNIDRSLITVDAEE